jgi:hypothetical protein
MSMTKATLTELARVAAEVQTLTAEVLAEIETGGTLAEKERGSWGRVPWPKEGAPRSTRPDGGKTPAALKRRSMDLTRLLAEIRRYN